jgi:hypothetical protein
MTHLMLALMLITSAADFASTEYGLAHGAIEAKRNVYVGVAVRWR